jgi:NCS1 family nucleobase:cation symporter-1
MIMAKIEEKSIDFIPEEERHGKVSSLGFLWLGINLAVLTVGTGAVTVTLGLNLAWSILAIIIGNALGALLMAAHSAQGPHLGIPQMIQSRAQFGVIGAIIPLIMVIIMYLGYAATGTVYTAQTFNALFPSIPSALIIIIAMAITAFIVIVGYDAIHFVFKWIAIVFSVLFLIITVNIFRTPLAAGSLSFGEVDFGMFLLAVSIAATWQACYAPYVADYSRYLPKSTKTSHTFWLTYGGTVVGAIWMMAIGAYLATQIPTFFDNQMAALADMFPWPKLFLVITCIAMLFAATMNVYGTFMSAVTVLEPISKLKITQKVRMAMICIIALVIALIAIYATDNFMAMYSVFLQVILYFLIPWTSINLVDFYFIRHGYYNVNAMFDNNGEYGKFNIPTIAVYFLTVLIEIPFISAEWYTGPIAALLHGGDIAWIVGGIFAAVVYYLINKKNIIHKKISDS